MDLMKMLKQVWDIFVETITTPLFYITPTGFPSEEEARLNFPHDPECHRNPFYDEPRMEDLGINWLDPPKLDRVYNFVVIDEDETRMVGSPYGGGALAGIRKRYLKCSCCDQRVQIERPTE